MSFGGFLLGVLLMGIGFLMVWRGNKFEEYFGELSDVFGMYNSRWLSWKTVGVVVIVGGFMTAFGLIGTFFNLTFSRFFFFGGSS